MATAESPSLLLYFPRTTVTPLDDGHRKDNGQPAVCLPNPFAPVQSNLLHAVVSSQWSVALTGC